ncbi:hypothetical protein JCM10207_000665 [Rhodosporidiobolus poonsookiae]
MRFSLVTLVASLSALALAAPTRRPSKRDANTNDEYRSGAAFTGTLYEPAGGASFAIGQNITLSYEAVNPEAGTPRFPSSIQSIDVGLQGPSPIELGKALPGGGPGSWINTTLNINENAIYKAGTYYLIITEHQLAVNTPPTNTTYRVQSYNVSIDITEA